MLTLLSLLLWAGADSGVIPSAPTALILEGHFQQVDMTAQFSMLLPGVPQLQVVR